MLPIRNAVPTRPPVVTWALILANALIIQIGFDPVELEEFLFPFALIPGRYFEPPAFGQDSLSCPISLLHRPKRTYRIYYPDEGILGFDPMGRP